MVVGACGITLFKEEVKMSDSNIILESWSPVCDIQAFVEESEKCY